MPPARSETESIEDCIERGVICDILLRSISLRSMLRLFPPKIRSFVLGAYGSVGLKYVPRMPSGAFRVFSCMICAKLIVLLYLVKLALAMLVGVAVRDDVGKLAYASPHTEEVKSGLLVTDVTFLERE